MNLSLVYLKIPFVFVGRLLWLQPRRVSSILLSDAWFQFPVTGPRLPPAFSVFRPDVSALLSGVYVQISVNEPRLLPAFSILQLDVSVLLSGV